MKKTTYLTVCFAFLLTVALQAAGAPQYYQLEPGDVILTVNGQSISGGTSLADAVNRSPQTMRFAAPHNAQRKI